METWQILKKYIFYTTWQLCKQECFVTLGNFRKQNVFTSCMAKLKYILYMMPNSENVVTFHMENLEVFSSNMRTNSEIACDIHMAYSDKIAI